MRKIWRATAITATAVAGLAFTGTAASAATATTVATPAAIVTSATTSEAVTSSVTYNSVAGNTSAPSSTNTAVADRGIVDKIKDLARRFPAMVRAVKNGWAAFKAWYDSQNPIVRGLIRAISPALTLFEIYELIRDVVG